MKDSDLNSKKTTASQTLSNHGKPTKDRQLASDQIADPIEIFYGTPNDCFGNDGFNIFDIIKQTKLW